MSGTVSICTSYLGWAGGVVGVEELCGGGICDESTEMGQGVNADSCHIPALNLFKFDVYKLCDGGIGVLQFEKEAKIC